MKRRWSRANFHNAFDSLKNTQYTTRSRRFEIKTNPYPAKSTPYKSLVCRGRFRAMLFSVVPTHVGYYYNYIRDQQQHHDVIVQRDVRRIQNGLVVNSTNFNNGTIWPNNRRAVKVFYNFKNFPLNGDRLRTVPLVFPPTQRDDTGRRFVLIIFILCVFRSFFHLGLL